MKEKIEITRDPTGGTLPTTEETQETEAPQETATAERTLTRDATPADSAPRAGTGTAVATATIVTATAATALTVATIGKAATKGMHKTVNAISGASHPKTADDSTATTGPNVTSPQNGRGKRPERWDSKGAMHTETAVSTKARATPRANKDGRKSTAPLSLIHI